MCACALHKHDRANGCAADRRRGRCGKAYEAKLARAALLTTLAALDGLGATRQLVGGGFTRLHDAFTIANCSVSFTSRRRSHGNGFGKSSDTSPGTAKFEFSHIHNHNHCHWKERTKSIRSINGTNGRLCCDVSCYLGTEKVLPRSPKLISHWPVRAVSQNKAF